MKTLLKNCRCFHYMNEQPVTAIVNIEIENGKISNILPLEKEISTAYDRVIDCVGMEVYPGGIDPHVHLSAGSFTYVKGAGQVSADSYKTGSLAAIAGGTTTIMDFAFSQFETDTAKDIIQHRLDVVKADGCFVDYAFHIALTQPSHVSLVAQGSTIEESFKIFTVYRGIKIDDSRDLFAIMKEIGANGKIAMIHCENEQVIAQNIRKLEDMAMMSEVRPEWNELESTSRVLTIAEIIGCDVHIAHVSLPDAVRIINVYKKRYNSRQITCEVTGHHLHVTSDEYKYSLFKEDLVMSPPLQSEAAVKGMQKMLIDNQIDMAISDHCPYTRSQRWGAEKPFQINHLDKQYYEMPAGTNGIQVRFIAAYSVLKAANVSQEQIAKQLSQNAADRFKLTGKGRIQVGYDADIVVVNPYVQTIWSMDQLKENMDGSLFDGMKFRGKIENVFAKGRQVGVDELEQGKYLRNFQ
ncbi:Dihydropyrimidinase [Hexamita inflata]|uniref:dihydropyrimidinase n=1 Tax=Hexamita inflata TaxID=28002 RepID=A0AA86PX64_9EUKA|nr:Dihydropyrimidinase [Hexamita inflata]